MCCEEFEMAPFCIVGCTDSTACNYDCADGNTPDEGWSSCLDYVDIDNGSCWYPEEGCDCDGTCDDEEEPEPSDCCINGDDGCCNKSAVECGIAQLNGECEWTGDDITDTNACCQLPTDGQPEPEATYSACTDI